MAEFDVASFSADVQVAGDIPAGALELRRRLGACDAFVISSPGVRRVDGIRTQIVGASSPA